MSFNNELAGWYNQNKRALPWRDTTDPYVIWLSEIILQQTRVEQGLPYFYRFLEKYPDVAGFAAADEDDILKLWQGLGYYSRGRNMLKTARVVCELYNGRFPHTYVELIRLKGIGEYTASAIASFSANEARAVVDGNVYRVLARYFGISEPVNSTGGQKIFRDAANQLLDRQNPGLHNQAMMELGAIICKPKNPACGICPVRAGCYAFIHNATGALPVKLKKPKVRDRFFNYFLVTDGETVLMNKRDETDIWANMYDLPLIETSALIVPNKLHNFIQVKEFFGVDVDVSEVLPAKTHLLTHQRLHVQFIKIKNPSITLQENWFYTPVENLKSFAMPKIIFIFLKNIFNL